MIHFINIYLIVFNYLIILLLSDVLLIKEDTTDISNLVIMSETV